MPGRSWPALFGQVNIRAIDAQIRVTLNGKSHTGHYRLITAAGVIAGTTIDLVGKIGAAVLASPLPPRRARVSPRVVKRAISKHRAKGPVDHRTYCGRSRNSRAYAHVIPQVLAYACFT